MNSPVGFVGVGGVAQLTNASKNKQIANNNIICILINLQVRMPLIANCRANL